MGGAGRGCLVLAGRQLQEEVEEEGSRGPLRGGPLGLSFVPAACAPRLWPPCRAFRPRAPSRGPDLSAWDAPGMRVLRPCGSSRLGAG